MMNGKKFIEMWDFVERKMNCTVPAYFKNILKACGYENAITIASIEEDDMQYFEKEVRNGNVSKYYHGMGVINILDGSTKSEANFEFTRGHRKFLRIIVDYLKQNASDSVMQMESKYEEEFKKTRTTPPPIRSIQLIPNEKKNKSFDPVTDQDIFLHRCMLTCQVIMNIIRVTPAMYAMNIESINRNELVTVEVKDSISTTLEAVIYCPLCSRQTKVLHEPSEDCKFLWNMSPFDIHLETEHLEQPQPSKHNESDHDHFTVLGVKQMDKMMDYGDNVVNSRSVNTSKNSIVCDPKTIVEDSGRRSYSKVLKTPSYECEFETRSSPTILNSKIQIHSENKSNKLLEISKTKINPPIKPKVGNFVVCSLLVKDTINWPSNANVKKYFVGKICQLEERSGNNKCIEGDDETFVIQFLNKHRHSKHIFYYPDQIQTSRITKDKIVKILLDPVNKRRGRLTFNDIADKAILDSFF